jgi:hypothetical protein
MVVEMPTIGIVARMRGGTARERMAAAASYPNSLVRVLTDEEFEIARMRAIEVQRSVIAVANERLSRYAAMAKPTMLLGMPERGISDESPSAVMPESA